MTKALKKKERIDPEDKAYKEAFEKLKKLITNAPVTPSQTLPNHSLSQPTPQT